MDNEDSSSPPVAIERRDAGPAFRRWQPSYLSKTRAFLVSEHFALWMIFSVHAWAVQNGIGVLFVVLFTVVSEMSFTLGCISACFYAAASQVLSLDRTIGGRIFGGVIFIGCVLGGALVGAALSSLAWLARGDAKGLLEYIPGFEQLPDQQSLTRISETLETLSSLPIPQSIRDDIETFIQAIEMSIPKVNDGFWILLMILFIVVSLPFCIARGCGDARIGIIMAIATLFLGSQIIFASLMPILGLHLFWTQITVGYIKFALVNAGAMLITGMLLLAKSSHDEARNRLGNVLQGAGSVLSYSGSIAARSLSAPEALAPSEGEIKSVGEKKSNDGYLEALRKEVSMLSGSRNVENHRSKHKRSGCKEDSLEQGQRCLQEPMARYTAMEVLAEAEVVNESLASMLFEPPLPCLCSQVGSNRSLYADLHTQILKLVSALTGIESAALPFYHELKCCREVESATKVQSVVVFVIASCAAICADAAVALRLMPLGRPCSGPKISWRPRSASFYTDLRTQLYDFAQDLSNVVEDLDSQISRMKDPAPLSPHITTLVNGREALLMVMTCHVLVKRVADVERSAAIALDLKGEVESLDNAANFSPNVKDKANSKTSSPRFLRLSGLKKKIARSAYFPFLMLILIGSGIVVWIEALKSFKYLAGWIQAAFESSASRARVLRDRDFQFSLKYWIGSSLAIVGIILILWKDKGSSDLAPEAAYNIGYFFSIWQPVYFWITMSICAQKQVESAASRAILRTLFTVLGGVLGYVTMLNGHLANNAYFVACMTVAFNAVCGLASPFKQLRYSLFLAAFTYNSLVVCQYVGTCCPAGQAKVFAGKVASTALGSLYAIFISWCFFPYYTSEVMFKEESIALQNGVNLIDEMVERMEKEPTACSKSSDYFTKSTEGNNRPETAFVDWERLVTDDIRGHLGRVENELTLNTVDRKQLPLTWVLLPTPPAIKVLLGRLAMFSIYLEGAGLLLQDDQTNSWKTSSATETALWQEISPLLHDLIESTNSLGEKCRDCMLATSARRVKTTRAAIRETVEELIEKIVRFKSRTHDLDTGNDISKELKWSLDYFKFESWLHLILLAMREVQVVGVILSETEMALDRHYYFAWLGTWFGRRPLI